MSRQIKRFYEFGPYRIDSVDRRRLAFSKGTITSDVVKVAATRR